MSDLPPWLQTSALVGLPLMVAWLLTAVLIRLAPRLGLIDTPSPRKVHATPTPRAGGIAIVTAFALAVPLIPAGDGGPSPLALLIPGLLIALLGLADDLRPLAWQIRLAVQTGVAVAALFLGWFEAGWLAPLAVLWIVAMINAFNMLDNMDALSPGVAAAAAGCLAAVTAGAGSGVCLALLGVLLGFLWFNRPPARIFMGDAGSTFLGFVLAVVTLSAATASDAPPWAWLGPPCFLAVACYDQATVVALRLSQGRSPFHADRQHLSHRLTDLGLSRPAAVGAIHLLAVASGLGGLLLYRVDGWAGAGLVPGLLAAVFAALAVVEYRRHFRRGDGEPEQHLKRESDHGKA